MSMTLTEIVNHLRLKSRTIDWADSDVVNGYASDLLSDVLANSGEGSLWVTNQKHQNIIGVAVMVNLAGIVITGGAEPDENTLEKAQEEKIPVFTTDDTMFEVVGRLYKLGIRSC